MYGLSAASDLPMTEILLNFESYGKEFAKYFLQPSKLFDYLGQHYNRDGFLKPKMESMSLISINFDGLEVLTVTKDAKITLPDMIGNIGGTLGVFIGFSFLGLLDTLIEIFQCLCKNIKKNHPLKIKKWRKGSSKNIDIMMKQSLSNRFLFTFFSHAYSSFCNKLIQ